MSLNKLPVYLTVGAGVLFVYMLGTQTPRQGRSLPLGEDEECALPDPCVAKAVVTLVDPGGVFDSVPLDSSAADTGLAPDPEGARA